MIMIRDWLWEHIFFHLLCKKDADYPVTGGGRYRNNFCRKLGRPFI